MENSICIIKQLQIVNIENRPSNAAYYTAIGYVESIEKAKQFCSNGKIFTHRDSWAIFNDTPEFIYEKLDLLEMENGK